MDISSIIGNLDSFVWGVPLMVLLLGTGIFLSIRLRAIQFRGFFHGIKILKGDCDSDHDLGEITHFQALSAALSATIGTGNIVGVAAAILLGGPGAAFWMWVTALFGMATKFTSCTLSVHFRRIDDTGEAHGGPMHFIEMGMGRKFKWLAVLFAIFTMLASFGIGNMFQSHSAAAGLYELVGFTDEANRYIFNLIVGLFFAVTVGSVILGGIKSIGRFAAKIVPFMCFLYVVGGLIILLKNYSLIPSAFGTIFYAAFHQPETIAGGLFGAVIRQGVRRGLFSNEAGLGSAAMAHGAAKTKEPVSEGLVAMLGPFIDTILICSITALVIVITGVYKIDGIKDSVLTCAAFEKGLGSVYGSKLVALGIVLFSFSTLVSWSYYGDRAVDYLFGKRAVLPYRIIYLYFVVLGALVKFSTIINFCDVMNGLMAIPNLIALIVLSPIVVKLTKDYFMAQKSNN